MSDKLCDLATQWRAKANASMLRSDVRTYRECAKELEAATVGPDEVHDAQIRLEEARWWQQTYHLGHLPDCSFDQTDGPEGDYCTCQLNRRKSEAFHRIATLKTNAERALGATSMGKQSGGQQDSYRVPCSRCGQPWSSHGAVTLGCPGRDSTYEAVAIAEGNPAGGPGATSTEAGG